MKRSPELTPLSHDHHQALFVALQLKRAQDPAPGQAYLAFLYRDGDRHFEIEESILLPGWLAADPAADREAADRVLAEHRELRAGAARLRSGRASVEELHALGELLEAHVRFEERELFPMIEVGLDEAALAELGAAIAAVEDRSPASDE